MTLRRGTEKHKLQFVTKIDSQLPRLRVPPILESIRYQQNCNI